MKRLVFFGVLFICVSVFSQGFLEVWSNAETHWNDGECKRAIELVENTRTNIEARKHPAYERRMKMLSDWKSEFDEMKREVDTRTTRMNNLRMEIIRDKEAFERNIDNPEVALQHKNAIIEKFQQMERLYASLDPENIKCRTLKEDADSKRRTYHASAEPVYQSVVETSDVLLFSALDSIVVLNQAIIDTVAKLLEIHEHDRMIIEAYEAREDTIRQILEMPYFDTAEFETPKSINSVIELAVRERGSRIKIIADMLAALYQEKYDNDNRFVYQDSLYWYRTRANLESMQDRLRQNPHLGPYGEEYARYLNKPISIINKSFAEETFPTHLMMGIIVLAAAICILLIMILIKVIKGQKAQTGPIMMNRRE